MENKVYPVLDKFTYNKPHQTDYSYTANNFEESENRIQPRLLTRRGAELLPGATPFELCDCAIPKNSFAFLEFEEPVTSLEGSTGFAVEYDCDADGPVEAVLRITLYSAKGATFLSIGRLAAGRHTLLFETSALRFPAKITGLKADVVSLCNAPRLRVEIVDLYAMQALDPLCRLQGQTAFFQARGGVLSQGEDGLSFYFGEESELISPEFPDNSDTVCNMLMPRRNTIFLALENNSALQQLTVAYRTTTHDDWCEKTIPIQPHSPLTAYYCNLSDTPNCDGRLRQFALRTHGSGGALCIRRYTFEEEKALETLAGTVERCEVQAEELFISGCLDSAFRTGTVLLYQTDPSDGDDGPDGKELIASCPAAETFAFEALPLRHNGITRLSAQFLLLLRRPDGTLCKIADRFGVQNAASLIPNLYAFEVPSLVVDCAEFGARGNAVDDDTAAIQAAIDSAAARGGGRVIVRGDDSFYGRRYLVTNLLLRSRIELVLEKGAVLWQSQDPADYLYRPTYGHDGVIEGINWTHCMHICNLPILHAHNCECVKISGQGKIRSMDTGSEEGLDMPGYSCGCPDRIHQISIGFFNVRHVNLSNFEIVRANNYHMSLYHCAYVSVIGVKMHEVKCVSGDGIGLGKGSHHVLISNVLFQSNDDAVTMTASYHDPRGILWWSSVHDGCCGSRDVRIEHSYLNSGGGKAVALLPWGTTQRYAEKAQMQNIEVTDCHLSCVSPVGAWADNPYAGRMPFDNAETDDWSPVMSVRIHDNLYQGNCAVYPLQLTDFITDCGLHSASQFLNGDFSLGGFANWNVQGKVSKEKENRREYGCIQDGSLCQGLYLEPGRHTLTARLNAVGEAQLFARNAEDDRCSAKVRVVHGQGEFTLSFETETAAMWYLGVQAQQCTALYACHVESDVDTVALNEARRQGFRAELEKSFVWNPAAEILLNETDGKLFLTGDAALGSTFRLESRQPLADFELEASFRVLEWHREQRQNSYGFLLRQQADGSAYCLRFLESEHRLKIQYRAADGSTEDLYCRENFFFTSDDFHSYRLRLQGDAITFWIDNAKYAAVHDGRLRQGTAAIFTQDLRYMLRRIALRPLAQENGGGNA